MSGAQKHVPALDGIRGIAILIVLFCHSASQISDATAPSHFFKGLLHNGWIGVDLFFVLSGYLITGILLRTKKSSNYFRTFYMRRVLRIFPIYYLTLTLVFLVLPHSRILSSWIPETWGGRIGYYLYLQNFPAFWRFEPGLADLLRPYWSLAVEEQFYLVWPLLVFVLSEKTILRLCGVIVVIALPLRIAAVLHWGAFPGFLYLTTTRFDGLFIGAALAITTQTRRIPLPVIWAGIATASFAWATIFLLHPAAFWDESTDPLVATFGVTALAILFGCVVALSQYEFPVLQRVLTGRVLRSFGKYSYGIYLFHFLLFAIAGIYLRRFAHWRVEPFPSIPAALLYICLSIAVVFFLAKFSFEIFESRFLRLKRFFEPDRAATLPPELATSYLPLAK